MEITDVRVTPYDKGSMKGLASVTFDNAFVVGSIKIISGSNGYFLGMPSRKDKDDEYRDICFPISKEFRLELQEAVLAKFEGAQPKTPPADEKKVEEFKKDAEESDSLPF